MPPIPLAWTALHAPVFKPHSKMSSGNELGREGLIEAVQRFEVPVVALGGGIPGGSEPKQSGIVGCGDRRHLGHRRDTDRRAARSALLDIEGIEARTGALWRGLRLIEVGEGR